jgi:DNA-directed RNA polymerase specialized sigma24 family protein
MNSMINNNGIDQGIARAFLGAFLLTADEVVAETAVKKCLDRLNSAEMTAEDLTPTTLGIARRLQNESELTRELPAWVSHRLPSELQNVLRLPADIRYCFVLRFLHGLCPDVCATILQLPVSQLESRTDEALCELAKMR